MAKPTKSELWIDGALDRVKKLHPLPKFALCFVFMAIQLIPLIPIWMGWQTMGPEYTLLEIGTLSGVVATALGLLFVMYWADIEMLLEIWQLSLREFVVRGVWVIIAALYVAIISISLLTV